MIQAHTKNDFPLKMKKEKGLYFESFTFSEMSLMYNISATVKERGGSNRSRKRNQSEVGKRKTARDLRRDNKRNMREVCFLKSHMFLEITQEEKEGTEEEKHMSVREGGSGCRDTLKDKAQEREGRLRQENLVPASNNLC